MKGIFMKKRMLIGLSILALVARSVMSAANSAGEVISKNPLPLSLKNPRTVAEQKLVDASLPTNYNFVSEGWTGDEQTYHLLRVKADKEILKGPGLDNLLLSTEAKARRKPRDPKAQFLWAYVAYHCRQVELEKALVIDDRTVQQAATLTAIRKLDGVRKALAEVPSPHNYDYSRMQFLVAANTDQAGEEIKPLGMRLLRHDPSDYAVESTLVLLLKPGLTAGDMVLGLSLTKDMIHRYPKLLEPHAQFAGLYSKYWSNHGFHRADAEKAISESRVYLGLLPISSPLRQNTVQSIQTIQTLQNFEEQRRSKGINDFPSK